VRLDDLGGPIVRARFAPSGRLVVCGTAGNREYDTRPWTGATEVPARAPADDPFGTTDCPELHDPTADVARHLGLHPRPHRAARSADGTRAATLTNGNLSVWDLQARTAVVERTSPTHGGWLSVAFDPRGRRIVTGGIDSTVAVWDAARAGPPLTTFQWGVGPVYAVTFDRDGLRAAAAGHSGAIVWDVDE
jgi:WD40 repeat protein